MQILKLHLKHFRLFSDIQLTFDEKIVVIQGANGSGKSSILEALHYGCYIRSFRTHQSRDMIAHDKEAYHITLVTLKDEISIGMSNEKRSIKINGSAITQYASLLEAYRVITFTEQDMLLIQGAPEVRRSFMDQLVMLVEPFQSKIMRNYRKVLEQRNALLSQRHFSHESYALWTEQLIEQATAIRDLRQKMLVRLEQEMQLLVAEFLPDHKLSLKYVNKDKQGKLQDVARYELIARRSLVGAHLDDLEILFLHKNARTYASRGQQKLFALLMKMASLKVLNRPAIFLLDDFITDFDADRIGRLVELLVSLNTQIFFTIPHNETPLITKLSSHRYQLIELPH